MLQNMLKQTVKSLINNLPRPIKKRILRLLYTVTEKKMIRKALLYYSDPVNISNYGADCREYITRMIKALKKERFSPFCGIEISVRQKYYERSVRIHKDKSVGLFYIMIDNKRIYFARGMSKGEIRRYFNEISLEQDALSPHRYFSDDKYFLGVIRENDSHVSTNEPFGVEKGDVVLDLGGAEGNFSLSVVDLAEKIYIIEADPYWIEALNATFSPYGSKVSIINTYISEYDDEHNITIDNLLKKENRSINFIKFDIEGHEEATIKGSLETLKKSENLKLALCTYHRPQDEQFFSMSLQELGFSFYFTDGYMAYPDNRLPLFRKGLIRAVKRQTRL